MALNCDNDKSGDRDMDEKAVHGDGGSVQSAAAGAFFVGRESPCHNPGSAGSGASRQLFLSTRQKSCPDGLSHSSEDSTGVNPGGSTDGNPHCAPAESPDEKKGVGKIVESCQGITGSVVDLEEVTLQAVAQIQVGDKQEDREGGLLQAEIEENKQNYGIGSKDEEDQGSDEPRSKFKEAEMEKVKANSGKSTMQETDMSGPLLEAQRHTLDLSSSQRLNTSSSDVGSMLSELEQSGDLLSSLDVLKDSSSSRDYNHLHSDLALKGSNGHISDGGSRAGSEGSGSFNYTANNNSKSSKSSNSEKKKKSSNWYNALSPTYKSKSQDFKKIFKDVPPEERLIVDYSCALQKDILVHGRLYITQNWVCFYANIFRWETVVTLQCKDVTAISKEKTARVIPNAIAICTENDKYFFTSFGARDKTFLMLFRVWQNALMAQPMNNQELWQWVHYSYGDELGLTSSDDDYMPPTNEDDLVLTYKLAEIQDKVLHTDTIIKGEEAELLTSCDLPNLVTTPTRAHSGRTPTLSLGLDNASMATTSAEDSLAAVSKLTNGTTGPTSSQSNCLSAPSPDRTSNDLPTDLGDTTEDSDSEIQCTGHQHDGFVALNDIFHVSVDQMFELLFTETDFYKEFIKARKTFDLKMSPWPDENDVDGNKVRQITYTLSLNYSIGPKVSPSTEKQIMYGHSQPGSQYIIDAEVVNGGVPYSDNFHVVNRYCLTRVSNNRCRLKVHCQIKFKKNMWGLVKNFVEKNAKPGIFENFSLLDLVDKNAKEGLYTNFSLLGDHLREEAERQMSHVSGQQMMRKKVLRRRRGQSQSDKSPQIKRSTEHTQMPTIPGTPTKGTTSAEDISIKVNADTLVRCVCAILMLLVFFNAVLFYKLWALESKAGVLGFSQEDILNLEIKPRSQEEWQVLLEQQQHLHEQEIDRWKDILGSSVQLMEQMKRTLEDLQATIEKRSRFLVDLRQKQDH